VIREREVRLASAKTASGSVSRGGTQQPDARVVFPKLEITTADLVQLYSDIADWAVPHAETRPLTLVRMRAPISRDNALPAQAAFVSHTAASQRFIPGAVPRIDITELKKVGQYCYVDSPKALLALIEAGVIEWHAWNARIDDVERPDRVVFDLDPGPGVSWARTVEAARRLRVVLEARDLESWVKTTGGKAGGLHVTVPFRREHGWDAVFKFSRDVATRLAAEDGEGYTISFDKRARAGKVLIDYKRNYRTSIAVAAFSTRARAGGTLSVPVKWEELARLGSGNHFTVANIRDRLRRLKVDPWRGYWTTKQRLRL
jgi:bifunctional non-homologous end joining protein LigD